MPTFCRHNRFLENCPICRAPEKDAPARSNRPAPRSGGGGRGRSAVRIRQAAGAADDGFRSPLAPGLRVSDDARRLAGEIAFSAGRLAELAATPPGLYARVRDEADPEEALWLAFLIAYLGPADGDDAFAAVAAAHRPWASGEAPVLEDAALGPRAAHDPARGLQTIEAYRAWAGRAGSQAAAFQGDEGWTPVRRFERVFERMSLPGLHRAARFDLLVMLGRLGRCALAPRSLFLSGADETTVAAKRALGIGDPLLLDRRALELAEACDVPLEALDLALSNWHRGRRATLGASSRAEDEGVRQRAAAALGL